MIRSRRFAAFLVSCAMSVAASCGGGGGGGSPSSGGGTAVGGVVALGDVAVAGARIDLLDGGGAALGQATSDADGSYRLTFSGAVPAAGLRLIASGGSAGSIPLAGSLRAALLPGDDLAHAHVTALTALVDRLGERLGPASIAAARAAGADRLAAVGALGGADWRALAPATVGLANLRQEALDRGASALVDDLAAAFAAGELPARWMGCFPRAHGGIAAIRVAGAAGGLTVPAGTSASFQLAPEQVGTTPDGGYTYRLVGAPAWAIVDAAGVLALSPPVEAVGTQALEVRVEAGATGLGRSLAITVAAPAAEVVAAGAVGPDGGTVLDVAGGVAVGVPPGVATGPTLIQVRRWVNAEGLAAFEVTSDPPLPQVSVSLPDPRGAVQLGGGASAASASRALRATSAAAAAPGTPCWLAQDPTLWTSTTAYFERGAQGQRLPRKAGGGTPLLAEERLASELHGSCAESDSLFDTSPTREPVLFIHGFNPLGGLGGGRGTWGDFLRLMGEAGYLPFEFRWDTAARFEDVAADLKAAVERIASRTHLRVHLVAHSFGGLLARTYLQGLAYGAAAAYSKPVASLTTIGTPHSGIADGSVYGLPIGRDRTWLGKTASVCPAISCFEAGDPDAWRLLEFMLRYGFDVTPGSIPHALADRAANPLPPGLPIQVLIGLWVNDSTGVLLGGDGLISFAGQRFDPSTALDPAPLLTGTVMEWVLGSDRWTSHGSTGPYRPGVVLQPEALSTTADGSVRYVIQPKGFHHSAVNLAGLQLLEAPFEPEVLCPSAETCTHDSFLRVRAFLSAHATLPATGDLTPPTAPGNVTVTALSSSRVRVSWSPSTDDTGIAGYDIQRIPGGPPGRVTDTSMTEEGLFAATQYCYEVTAVDVADHRTTSARACGTTPGAAPPPATGPADLHAVSVGSTRVELAWTAPPSGVATYVIYRDGVFALSSLNPTAADTGVGTGQRHCYVVYAWNAVGIPSPPSNELCVTTLGTADTTAPSVPDGLTVTTTAATQLTVRWAASTDASGVTAYRVFRNGAWVGDVPGTAFTDGPLAPGTQSCYRIQATDAVRNWSALSIAACATTPAAPDATPPSTPSGLAATLAGPNRVVVTWSASTDDLAVAGYRVYRDGQLLRTVAGTRWDDTAVVTGTRYCYTVSAYDAALNPSPRSGESCATPAAAAAVNPRVSVTPGRGARGTVFSEPGTGFTPGGMVVLHFRYPDGSEATATTSAGPGGSYAWLYDSSANPQRGVFTYWAVDAATGTRSPDATFRITPDAVIDAFSTQSHVVALEGAAEYVTSIGSQTGAPLGDVYLQAWVAQGAARRGAGGGNVSCGAGDAVLPAGCMQRAWLVVSNTAGGSGTLVPGAATAVLELKRRANGVDEVLDTATWPIELVTAVAAPLSDGGGGSWSYRRLVGMWNSTPTANPYVVRVDLETGLLASERKLRPDFGDLRFTDSAGAELPWWPESVSSTWTTTVWVRVSAISTDSGLYAYYGNPSATRGGLFAGNGRATFDLFDDFDAAYLDSIWASTSARWPMATALSGAAHLSAASPDKYTPRGSFLSPSAWFSGSTVTEFRMTRSAAPNDQAWKSSSFAVHAESTGLPLSGSEYAVVASGWWSNDPQDCAPINGSYRASVRADVSAGTLSMTLGGTACGSKTLAIPGGSGYAVTLAVEVGNGTDTVDVDDFRIRPLIDPEPVTSVCREEARGTTW